jgi:hypothetical protein
MAFRNKSLGPLPLILSVWERNVLAVGVCVWILAPLRSVECVRHALGLTQATAELNRHWRR